MHVSQNCEVDSAPPRRWSLDRLFDAAKKDTVIRLRWPLLILSSYLLYYTPSTWLTLSQVQAILILYLLSHSTLYFLADDFFDSRYFYGPLLIFDTMVLIAVLSTTGTASPDFYLACLLTAIMTCVCSDTRGLLALTFLAPLMYGCFVFYFADDFNPNIYLRLPFPFVISLFYGYFAQVERIRRTAREKEERARQEQKAAEEIRRQRERLEVLHRAHVAMSSTIETDKLLAAFLETTLIHLPYAAGIVRLKNCGTGALETAAARNLKGARHDPSPESLVFADRLVDEAKPLAVGNVFTDPEIADYDFFKNEGLLSFVSLPLVGGGTGLGCLVFFTREEHRFGEEEINLLSTLAGQLAIAIHHAQLYEQSRQQSEEVRGAHQTKNEFLRSVSKQLKTPLSVITGYAEMFLEGALGELTLIQETAIATMARQSKDLSGLLDTLLQVSNIETEPLHLELYEINLWEFLSEVRSRYDEPLTKNLKLVWNYPSDLPSVRVDRRKLKQILESVIDNGIKFTQCGAVTISVHYRSAKQTLEIEVADTGMGMPEEQIPRIFEKFCKGADTSASEPNGVGLGLYIVKKYVDLLGGAVHVESCAGQGSTFTLRIPAPLSERHSRREQICFAS
jgi:signal transduction histidine kinase